MRKIIFSGGGLKGITYIGIIHQLNKMKYDFEEYHGCSIGSVFALLYLIQISPKDMLHYIKQLSQHTVFGVRFKQFLKEPHALFSNDFLRQALIYFLGKKGFSCQLTFKTLFQATGKSLHVYATDIQQQESKVCFNHMNTPEFFIVDAILGSCAIPGLLPGIKTDKAFFVDGMLAYDFPYTAFDASLDVSFYFQSQTTDSESDHLVSYFLKCIKSMKNNNYTNANKIVIDGDTVTKIANHFKKTGKLCFTQLLKLVYIGTQADILLKE